MEAAASSASRDKIAATIAPCTAKLWQPLGRLSRAAPPTPNHRSAHDVERPEQTDAQRVVNLGGERMMRVVGPASCPRRSAASRLTARGLLTIDAPGLVPLSNTGAGLPFGVVSRRCERGPIVVASNPPFDEWTEIFGSERRAGAVQERLTHRARILGMHGESCRLERSGKRRA